MKGKIVLVVCVCALVLFSVPAIAVFEVPEDAVTFEELGLSGTYDADAVKCQTKEVTLRFAEPSELKIAIYVYRDNPFNVKIYVNGLLATEKYFWIYGNHAETITIPGAFIKAGENTIRLEFIDGDKEDKFSEYLLTIAPNSYIVSTGAPEIVSPARTPTPVSSPTPSPVTPATPTATPTTPAQTPTPSPGQIPTPIPKPAGFEAVFALVAVLMTSLLIRKEREK